MKRKIASLIFLIAVVTGFFTYNYIYKEHRNIAKEEALFFDKAMNFHSDFVLNSDEFNTKYLDKVIKIEGEITEFDNISLVLDKKIYVVFNDSLKPQIDINDFAIIKGRFVGYDDLLEVLKIDQATVIDK